MRDVLSDFFARHAEPGVVAVYLHGSHASGTAHSESDVDVAVLLDRDVFATPAGRFDYRLRLAASLSGTLQRQGFGDADVVILNDAPPLFARAVIYDGDLIAVSDPGKLRDFERDVQLRAADLAPFLARYRRVKLEALAR